MSNENPENLPARPRQLFFPTLTIAAICAVWAAPTLAAEISIPGTRVVIDAPDGFVAASGFAGLQRSSDGSTIMVTEMPVEAYTKLASLFADLPTAKKRFAQSGVVVKQTSSVETPDQHVPIVIGTQTSGGVEFQKYMALFRSDATVLVTFNVFDTKATTQKVVEATVASVKLVAAPTVNEKREQLPFSFDTAGPFRLQWVVGGSTAGLTTIDGTDPTGLLPMVAISRGLSRVAPGTDLKLVSTKLLSGTKGFEQAETKAYREIEFAGGPGYYMEVETQDRTLVQYIRIPADGMFVRLVALGEKDQLQEVMPSVAQIAASILPR